MTTTPSRADLAHVKIEFASTEELDSLRDVLDAFFRDVLEMDPAGLAISDESYLTDFEFCGGPNDSEQLVGATEAQWAQWVMARTAKRFGVHIDSVVNMKFVDLFKLIKQKDAES